VRSLPALLGETDWTAVNEVLSEMEDSGVAMLRDAGLSLDNVETVRSADMRLIGQIHEINVPVPEGVMDASGTAELEDRFHQIYQSLYSRRNLSIPVQVQNWRVLVRAPQLEVRVRHETRVVNPDLGAALKGTRRVYFHSVRDYVDCRVYDRYRLMPGHLIPGPAIVEERESTAVLGPRERATIDEVLNLVIEVG
jgi:N-methylhydantoinase A/oxoprolinase/acetone carboxylase beta subunit